MQRTYFLKSNRIGFSIWRLDDWNIALELWSDPEITKYIGGPYSNAQVKRRLLTERAIFRLHNIQYWPMFLLNTYELIGYCGLKPYKVSEKIYELGILLKKEYWGKGYGVEAAHTIIDYAFTSLHANGLFAVHDSSNTYSKVLLIELGFKYCGEEYSIPTSKYDPSYILFRQG